MSLRAVRRASAKLFGNEKLVEVVLALEMSSRVATAQQLSERTGIAHSMVRDVLVRLLDAEVLIALPRASSRAPQYYEAREESPVWPNLVSLARALTSAVASERAAAVGEAS